jgi:hypothetical protein
MQFSIAQQFNRMGDFHSDKLTISSHATNQFDQLISLCFVTNRSIARLRPTYHNVTQ